MTSSLLQCLTVKISLKTYKKKFVSYLKQKPRLENEQPNLILALLKRNERSPFNLNFFYIFM